MDDHPELDHHAQLRAWAKGPHPLEAATELLIRAGRAGQDEPWVRSDDAGGHWIDFESVPEHLGDHSVNDRRLLLIGAAIASHHVAVNLTEALSGLDRDTVGLVLAAVAHAAGTHEDADVPTGNTDAASSSRGSGMLYPWPE